MGEKIKVVENLMGLYLGILGIEGFLMRLFVYIVI